MVPTRDLVERKMIEEWVVESGLKARSQPLLPWPFIGLHPFSWLVLLLPGPALHGPPAFPNSMELFKTFAPCSPYLGCRIRTHSAVGTFGVTPHTWRISSNWFERGSVGVIVCAVEGRDVRLFCGRGARHGGDVEAALGEDGVPEQVPGSVECGWA